MYECIERWESKAEHMSLGDFVNTSWLEFFFLE